MRLYLGAVTGLSVLIIALLVTLFFSGFPGFLAAFQQNPAQAIRNDPASTVLIVTIFGTVGVLMGIIVVIGSRYNQFDDY